MNPGVFSNFFEGGFAQGVLAYGTTALVSGFAVFLMVPLFRKATLGMRASVFLSALLFCCLVPLGLMSQAGSSAVEPGPESQIEFKKAPLSAVPALSQRDVLMAPMPVKVRPHEFNYFRIGGFLWLGGVALVGVAFLRRCWNMRDAVLSLAEPESSSLRTRFTELKSEGLSHVRLLEGPGNQMPCCGGVRHPFVIVPHGFEKEFTEAEQAMILTHELGHLEHRDVLLSYLQALGGILYWWNPLVHGINRRLSLTREQLCDRKVVRESGDAKAYASCLLKVAERTQAAGSALSGAPALAMSGEFRRMRERVKSVLAYRKATSRRRRWKNGFAGLATLLVLGAVTLSFSRWELQALPQKDKAAKQEATTLVDGVTIKAMGTSYNSEWEIATFTGNAEVTFKAAKKGKVVIKGETVLYDKQTQTLEVSGPGLEMTYKGRKVVGMAKNTRIKWDLGKNRFEVIGRHKTIVVPK